MITTANPILAEMNRTVDDPSVAVALPLPLAETFIELAGGHRPSEGPGRWVFDYDGFWTWETDEALRYALHLLPDLVAELVV